MRCIDISADVGEDFVRGIDAIEDELMRVISSCHVCCGVHSGTQVTVERTVQRALAYGVAIGAHPSYPDRDSGGRKSLSISHKELTTSLVSQLTWINEIVTRCGGRLRHVKPHGALYNDMARDRERCETVLKAIKAFDPKLIVFGMAGSIVGQVCDELKLRFVAEGFIDRRYEDATTLVSRSQTQAVLSDPVEVEAQIRRWVHGQVVDRYDRVHHVSLASLCVHSDAPGVLMHAEVLQRVLRSEHVTIAAPE